MKLLKFKRKSIHYKSLGDSDSPCLVLLHGFMESKEMWKRFEFLQKSHYLLFIDLPGHGDSESIYKRHSMPLMAHIVQQVLLQESIKEAKILGHSLGGYVALAMAEHYPSYCSEIILFHSHPFADDPIKLAQRKASISLVNKDKSLYCHMMIPHLFFKKEEHREEINQLIELSKNMSEIGITSAIEGMMRRKDKVHILQNSQLKTTFVLGTEDGLIPEPKKIKLLFPEHSTYIIENTGHMSHIEDWKNCKKIFEKILH